MTKHLKLNRMTFWMLLGAQRIELWYYDAAAPPPPLIMIPLMSVVNALWNMCLCTKASREPKKRYFSMQPSWYHFYVRNWQRWIFPIRPWKVSQKWESMLPSASVHVLVCLCACLFVLVCTWRQWESGVLFISEARAVIAQQINLEPHDISWFLTIHIALQWKASICWIQTFWPKADPATPPFKLC